MQKMQILLEGFIILWKNKLQIVKFGKYLNEDQIVFTHWMESTITKEICLKHLEGRRMEITMVLSVA